MHNRIEIFFWGGGGEFSTIFINVVRQISSKMVGTKKKSIQEEKKRKGIFRVQKGETEMSKIVAPSHNMSHDCSDSESENIKETIGAT